MKLYNACLGECFNISLLIGGIGGYEFMSEEDKQYELELEYNELVKEGKL